MHDHAHNHGTGKVLVASLLLTIGFVVGEAIAGLRSHSLALLSDAGHNLTDAAGLVLAGIAYVMQSRPGTHTKTFGYHRTGVLAAFANALLLVGIAVVLFYESVQRLLNPQQVTEGVMLWVAAIGLVLNVAIAWGLESGRADLNLRAAWIHMLGDAASCVAIIVGAIIIRYTGWLAIDPLLSILIAAV